MDKTDAFNSKMFQTHKKKNYYTALECIPHAKKVCINEVV